MALTNAERQARWRERRNMHEERIADLERRVAHLEMTIFQIVTGAHALADKLKFMREQHESKKAS